MGESLVSKVIGDKFWWKVISNDGCFTREPRGMLGSSLWKSISKHWSNLTGFFHSSIGHCCRMSFSEGIWYGE